MNLYITIASASIISFLICLFYYKFLFREAMNEEKKKHVKDNQKASFSLWLATFVNLIITSLIYGLLGYTFNIFTLAPTSTPFVLSLLLWLFITAVLITSAARTKQSQVITFLHSGFWLVTLLIYAILFPFLMQISF